ncbi:hypothetical protein RJ639_014315 [Escallonia herrerae]|uniref:Uncharacterized protein n=1 Tax=Escallonia herrerae TaxID=1293975 RepID=A0AA88VHG8_9ASTE|nr:hypothetical protein RJ639_014315 [Escallonia herrerae]
MDKMIPANDEVIITNEGTTAIFVIAGAILKQSQLLVNHRHHTHHYQNHLRPHNHIDMLRSRPPHVNADLGMAGWSLFLWAIESGMDLSSPAPLPSVPLILAIGYFGPARVLWTDIPMAQFIINMNASLPQSQKFIIHVLDSTHLFVRSDYTSSTSSSSSSSPSASSTENDLESGSESRSSQVGTSTLKSQVGTSTPPASTLFPRRDALGEIKDEGEDKFDEDTWFSADEKRNKMIKESIVKLLKECPLPPPFSAPLPALQEPANMRSSGKWEFPRKWNGFCKDYEKKSFLAPNATTKKLIDHIKRRGGLNIDETLIDQEMRHAGLIPPAPTMPVPPTPIVESRVVLRHTTQVLAIRTSSSRTPSLEKAGKGEGAKGLFLGLLKKASKGKRKEGAGEGSSPMAKRCRTPTPPVPPLVVEDLPIDKDLIFCPR